MWIWSNVLSPARIYLAPRHCQWANCPKQKPGYSSKWKLRCFRMLSKHSSKGNHCSYLTPCVPWIHSWMQMGCFESWWSAFSVTQSLPFPSPIDPTWKTPPCVTDYTEWTSTFVPCWPQTYTWITTRPIPHRRCPQSRTQVDTPMCRMSTCTSKDHNSTYGPTPSCTCTSNLCQWEGLSWLRRTFDP